MSQLVLDAGAFAAYERGRNPVRARVAAARRLGLPIVTSAPVLGQVWRDGRRQALLAGLLRGVRTIAADEAAARRGGELLALTTTTDIVDALLANLCRTGDTLLTSDPGDLRRLLRATNVNADIVAV